MLWAIIFKENLDEVVSTFMKFFCHNMDLSQNSVQVSEFQWDVSISPVCLSES